MSIAMSTSTANNEQFGGTHYKNKVIQPWDFIAANNLGFFEGNIVKYVSRWREKGGVTDLKKARHYLDKLIELNVHLDADARPRFTDLDVDVYVGGGIGGVVSSASPVQKFFVEGIDGCKLR